MEVFYSNQIDGDVLSLSPEESAHCVRVLRHKVGDQIKVSGGDGNLYKCVIEDTSVKKVQMKILSIEAGFGTHNYFLQMAVAPTKNIDRYEWFLEKSTELGIDRITPILCAHSERRVLKKERGDRVILAAAKQSLKGKVPQLDELTSIKDFITSTSDFKGLKLIAYCDQELTSDDGSLAPRNYILDVLSKVDKEENPSVMILIGPEGDFSMAEVELALSNGFIPVSFGESRLRAETAAVFAVSAVYMLLT